MQDKRLMTAVSTHGHDWTKVARYVGHAVTRAQCLKRWVDMVDPDESALANKGIWLVHEVRQRQGREKKMRVLETERQIVRKKFFGFINNSGLNR
jgi:hypothetical protein